MNSQTLSSRADLEIAEVALRDSLLDLDPKGDGTSLRRILVHLVNMHEALSSSPESHSNVAKRLGDFAVTTARMATKHPQAAAKLERLSDALRAAGERLSEQLSGPPVADAAAGEAPSATDYQRHISTDAAIQLRS
jgi:hypothetical protein